MYSSSASTCGVPDRSARYDSRPRCLGRVKAEWSEVSVPEGVPMESGVGERQHSVQVSVGRSELKGKSVLKGGMRVQGSSGRSRVEGQGYDLARSAVTNPLGLLFVTLQPRSPPYSTGKMYRECMDTRKGGRGKLMSARRRLETCLVMDLPKYTPQLAPPVLAVPSTLEADIIARSRTRSSRNHS